MLLSHLLSNSFHAVAPPARYLKEGVTQRHDTSASQAVMYKEFYTRNNEAAIQKIKASAANIFPNRERSLAKVLRGQLVCELQTHTLPRPFKSEQNLEGTAIKVGRCTGLVKRELGRGMYGAVALLDGGEHEDIAIKVQCPAGCLAHEYNILRKVEERLKGDSIFPRALSFLYFADGALMGTTAASKTGINLIDLVNVYNKSSERMPEILALHYTARMLGHIETLHWKGKILVRVDVIPARLICCLSRSSCNWPPSLSSTAMSNLTTGCFLKLVRRPKTPGSIQILCWLTLDGRLI